MLVLIILTQKIDAVINMTDPETQVNSRHILKSEVDEVGDVNFAEHKLQIGFYLKKEW